MDTFNSDAFTRLKKAEQRHFWFSVRRRYIYDRIKKFILPPAKTLEIGCGTGNVSNFLSAKGYEVTGCEYFPEALEIAYENFTKVRGNALSLPFKEKSFNIVGLFDVIEHFDDDKTVLIEAKRAIKPGGIIAITVPAKEELWGYPDEKAHHKRRYSKKTLSFSLSAVGFKTLSIEYIFSFLYFPVKFSRKKKPKGGNKFIINPILNKFLQLTFETERVLNKVIPMPIGTSLIAIGTPDE